MTPPETVASDPAPPRKRRKRRSSQEITDLIVEAAIREFGENGYASATTAAIARRAEVAEALIFTHFGGKADLFRKAVFKPLDDHFSNFIATHAVEAGNVEQRRQESRAFVSDLVRFVRRHSDMFKSLVVNEAYAKDGDLSGGLQGLQDYFDKMSALEEAKLHGEPKVPARLISRISFASILGSIVFSDWLFPRGVASDEEVHDGLCDFIMEGLSVNPGLHHES